MPRLGTGVKSWRNGARVEQPKPEVWKCEGTTVYRLQDADETNAFLVNEFTIQVGGHPTTTTPRHRERLAQRICYLLNEDLGG